jgi:hypothetical protein
MTPQLRREARRALAASVAPFAILITPFAMFVHYQQYGFARAEIVIAIAALAAIAMLVGAGARLSRTFEVLALAALLTWVADIQLADPGMKRLCVLFVALCVGLWFIRQHAATIVSLMMATVLAASLVPASQPAAAERAAAPRAPRGALPLIVHLVLDEHTGVEGVPVDLAPDGFREALQSFFTSRGFRLFGSAYSEHPATEPSLSHMMNLASGSYVTGLSAVDADAGTYRLTRNAYFTRLGQAGYSIRVHQPDHLNVCADGVAVSACRTYHPAALRTLDALPTSAIQKLTVVSGTFLARSEAVGRFKQLYRGTRRRLAYWNLHLLPWDWDRSMVAPVAAMVALREVAADLARAERGEFVYAHLLLPHYPYVYDEACRPRPPSEWLMRIDPNHSDEVEGTTNTREGRAVRYDLYFQQMHCVHQKLDELLAAIPPSLRRDAIVIVQGDHGARIGLVKPTSDPRRPLTDADYADHFSTLFAVRSPQIDAGYDPREASVTCLLKSLVASTFKSVDGADVCSASRVVFFEDQTPHLLPRFASPTVRSALGASRQRGTEVGGGADGAGEAGVRR